MVGAAGKSNTAACQRLLIVGLNSRKTYSPSGVSCGSISPIIGAPI